MNKGQSRQIVQLLSVVFAGVIAALVVAGGMLYTYGPTGRYLAKNVLLSPEMTGKLAYQDQQTKMYLVFDHVVFSYFNPESKQFRKVVLDKDQYVKFYEMVGNDRSMAKADDGIVALFNQKNPATLIVNVKSRSVKGDSMAFQEVNFVHNGDYFRVELANDLGYAYFYHPKIYGQIMELFTQ